MYYGDTVLDNDHEVRRLERASKKAAAAWRFRHFEHREARLIRALVARLLRPLVARRQPRETAARPTREQLSY